MEEKVSIIIPVYKAEKTIERCVQSIAEGTYQNVEIILVEDCSPDASLKKCRILEKKYDSVIVKHNIENRGVSYTRNQGLKYITGKYLMFVDSDDWVEPDYVERFVNEMAKEDLAMVISGYVNHDEVFNGRTDIFGWGNTGKIQVSALSEKLPELYHNRLLQQLWNKIFRAEVVLENEICFDETISMGEDFRFILEYLAKVKQKSDKCVLLDRPLYHYIRDNETSLMSTFGNENIAEPLKNISLMSPLLDIGQEEQKLFYEKEKDRIVGQYAYRIMHNSNYSVTRKIDLLKEVSGSEWRKWFVKLFALCVKEKIAQHQIKIKK